MAKGKLYLIPTTLGSETTQHIIPAEVAQLAIRLRSFAVEDIKSARRYLRKLDREFPIDESRFFVINKRSTAEDVMPIIRLLLSSEDVGVISEAGCPGIADPGAELVAVAHQHEIHVHPLVGPSSILLTLIASGFNGQQFAFHGYLPKDRKERVRKIKDLEFNSRKSGVTNLFMETPFRNNNMIEDLLNELMDDTLLCIGSDLTNPNERIQTMTVAEWREKAYDLNKIPAIFAIGKYN
ncbi:MAG: SAM-dependent methyltransferase [Flavobacteriia bacterium]|nr:SAM-dependent methyltransferase [Flavobacteriia bacterium]OJX39689.1 MAG: SAM-dependent methyltransferase [Flavobacteriia bacterium 40-80]